MNWAEALRRIIQCVGREGEERTVATGETLVQKGCHQLHPGQEDHLWADFKSFKKTGKSGVVL